MMKKKLLSSWSAGHKFVAIEMRNLEIPRTHAVMCVSIVWPSCIFVLLFTVNLSSSNLNV